jgi:hypothetical protein
MPAAFYEFNIEQGSDFITSVKAMKPGGGIFRFIPKANQTVWTDTTLNIDVPEEIKLFKSTESAAFGWMKGIPSSTFLTVRSKVKDNKGVLQIQGTRVYTFNGSTKRITTTSFSPVDSTKELIEFTLVPDNTEYNLTMRIPAGLGCGNPAGSAPTGTTCYSGKYLYDIELEYKIGDEGETPTSFVIRLLQGRMTFNPNVTT